MVCTRSNYLLVVHGSHKSISVLFLKRNLKYLSDKLTLHTGGKMHFDDIMLEKKYTPMTSYSQSKLANILFTKELAKRLEGN